MSDEPVSGASDPADPRAKAELDRAFEQLYRDHLRDVYSYAYYRVGNHHDAEDITAVSYTHLTLPTNREV